MSNLLRQEIIQTAEVIVIKVGTNVLTLDNGLLNLDRIGQLAEDLWGLMSKGRKVILVSSGAVGAGMGRLKLEERPTEITQIQALAAIGQGKLMEAYEQALRRFQGFAAQVLITAEDLSNRKRYLNTRNALRAIMNYGALPIINENDTVSVEELHMTFGDNDRLASLVANLFESPLLVLLTDVDGLYDGNPAMASSKFVPLVEKWSPALMDMVAEKRSKKSKGGMSSKLKAAKTVTTAGGNMLIANGDTPGTLSKIFAGEEIGSLFLAHGSRLSARKRWIGFAGQPKGKVTVDPGAATALVKKGKSLLPIGITDSQGSFNKGDLISIMNEEQLEIARGLSNYGLKDLQLVQGKKTRDIRQIFGHCTYQEVVHCDNLFLLD